MILKLVLIFICVGLRTANDNGLGLTPPMGWLSWLRFRCTTDCTKYPSECISEKLIMDMADQMALKFRASGYSYVMIDDCWLAKSRDPNGALLPDPQRFPRGIKFLSDYVHSKGLKFGIYEDCGLWTCAGYPGSLLHLEQDANTFASWGVDYVKFDGCYSLASIQLPKIAEFSAFLNKTGRQIFLNVEWPLYYKVKDATADQVKVLRQSSNMARVFDDIDDNWSSMLSVIDFYKANVNNFSSWAHPGYFNDPDMLLIGNNYVTESQEKLQMTMWTIMAAPLIMSNDLRNISEASVSILNNKNIIALNQDRLGLQGKYVITITNIQIWVRQLANSKQAIALVNTLNTDQSLTFSLKDININDAETYLLTEVYDMVVKFKVNKDSPIAMRLNAYSAEIFTCEKLSNN